jgi:hypothetical protein
LSSVFSLDPLQDSRWPSFLQRSPTSSAFHSLGWLHALHRTYGYTPIVYTTTPPGEQLANGIVFCVVTSYLTGRRIVSLPFSDHCEPLVSSDEERSVLFEFVVEESKRRHWKYAEVRPRATSLPTSAGFGKGQGYWLHTVDLRNDIDHLFAGFHRDSIQRRIRRAEREGLTYEVGISTSLLENFYKLMLMTRRRHKLPPQPRVWFKNLAQCMGDGFKIHLASRRGEPVACIATLHCHNTVIYKYGCSNAKFNNLGGTPFLFWKAIKGAKENGADEFDLGRSDLNNSGLIAFKDHWASTRKELTYWRNPVPSPGVGGGGWKTRAAKRLFESLPEPFLSAAGRILYRHVG